MDRKNTLVSAENDKNKEDLHILVYDTADFTSTSRCYFRCLDGGRIDCPLVQLVSPI